MAEGSNEDEAGEIFDGIDFNFDANLNPDSVFNLLSQCYIDELMYYLSFILILLMSVLFSQILIFAKFPLPLWRKHNFPFVISKKFAKEYFIMFQNFQNSRLMIKSPLNPRLRVFLRKFQVLISVIFGECFILAAMQIFNFCEVMRLGFFLKLKINIQIAVPMSCKRIIRYFSK